MDNRRGFKKPYSETILGYQNNEKSVEDFVELVTKSFKISHRFSRLHAKLMGEKKLTIFDRNVSLGKINKEFNFKESVSIVRSVFEKIDKDYANILDKYLENGQIDVYPKTGKRGGAYCWGMGKLHVFVLLNHVNNIRSLETLAHEMGHAFHTEMSKGQPVLYRGYTTSTAEVASTFFEQAVVDEIENHLSDKEKAILLHRKIIGDISTIFRQVACFNFEKELHERIRDEGQLTKEEIAKLMSKHLRSYLGSAVEVTDDDGYAFVSWPHIRRFFYVYTYAHGQLISKALYENYKKDPMYADKVKSFLKAGQSMSPEDIFKSIGVDISKPEFFEIGLRSIEKDIDRLEKLTSK